MPASRSLPCSRRRFSRVGGQNYEAYGAQVTFMTTGKKERVGIVGVGRMGLAMLKHLVRHGYQVTACDIDDEKLAKARDSGAPPVKTPAGAARGADFVIIGVGYDDEVNQVALGTQGLLANLASGSIIAV